ncbi:MAG: ankyrin repeat domain-containing protein [Treponema sp.]|nr:ankyrin repeat domain-containing protein [Treponema sp.]
MRIFKIIPFIFLTGTLFADDYQWNLVNALARADFQAIENILKTNINTMSAPEKRLVINFTIIYSHGENTLRVFDLLQKYNIHPNSFDLYTAINRNQSDAVIQFLLQSGIEPNGEILLLAMVKQRFDIARQFIEAKVDVNYQYPLTRPYADGMTSLLYAAKYNNFELVQLLLDHGANINAMAKDGTTALSIAQRNGNNLIYNYLMEHGASQTGNNILPPQNTGMASILDNQLVDFQTGTYRLFGGNADIRFSGNNRSGNISYTLNGRASNGLYRIENNNITIIMEGRTFIYNMDSNTSFSGNGEVWVRIGN